MPSRVPFRRRNLEYLFFFFFFYGDSSSSSSLILLCIVMTFARGEEEEGFSIALEFLGDVKMCVEIVREFLFFITTDRNFSSNSLFEWKTKRKSRQKKRQKFSSLSLPSHIGGSVLCVNHHKLTEPNTTTKTQK